MRTVSSAAQVHRGRRIHLKEAGQAPAVIEVAMRYDGHVSGGGVDAEDLGVAGEVGALPKVEEQLRAVRLHVKGEAVLVA